MQANSDRWSRIIPELGNWLSECLLWNHEELSSNLKFSNYNKINNINHGCTCLLPWCWRAGPGRSGSWLASQPSRAVHFCLNDRPWFQSRQKEIEEHIDVYIWPSHVHSHTHIYVCLHACLHAHMCTRVILCFIMRNKEARKYHKRQFRGDPLCSYLWR